jgi:glucosamine--fructose-6-phosphate aminotransferase (isomerizing)
MIVLGRKAHFATAREAALKIKELAYIHSEGFMAGELKHGPVGLIDASAFVILFATGEDVDMLWECLKCLEQIKAKVATAMVVATQDEADQVRSISDHLVLVPKGSEWVQTIINIIPMQLPAYHSAAKKGLNVDRPRNLAKSVTVV